MNLSNLEKNIGDIATAASDWSDNFLRLCEKRAQIINSFHRSFGEYIDRLIDGDCIPTKELKQQILRNYFLVERLYLWKYDEEKGVSKSYSDFRFDQRKRGALANELESSLAYKKIIDILKVFCAKGLPCEHEFVLVLGFNERVVCNICDKSVD